ncbi:response regulator [Nanoarchaeota archaeon]
MQRKDFRIAIVAEPSYFNRLQNLLAENGYEANNVIRFGSLNDVTGVDAVVAESSAVKSKDDIPLVQHLSLKMGRKISILSSSDDGYNGLSGLIRDGHVAYFNAPINSENSHGFMNFINSEMRFLGMGSRTYEEKNTVLIVDDEEIIRDTYSKIVEGAGYPCLMAANQQSTFKQLRENQVSTVLLDKKLRNDDGATIAKRIRRFYPYVEILYCTGHPENEDYEKLGKIVYDFLAKPIDKDDLLESLRGAFEKRIDRITRTLNSRQPYMVILAGQSGTGKTDVLQQLARKSWPGSRLIQRYTTRDLRPDEIDGEDKIVVSEEKFEELKPTLLWWDYQGNPYGVEKSLVERTLDLGRDALFTVATIPGVKIIKEVYGDLAKVIWFKPEDLEPLIERTKKRGGYVETMERARMKYAEFEKAFKEGLFDHIVMSHSNITRRKHDDLFDTQEFEILDLEAKIADIVSHILGDTHPNRNT